MSRISLELIYLGTPALLAALFVWYVSRRPNPKWVNCPECHTDTVAVIPKGEIVAEEANADGKSWVECHECGVEFLVYYRRET